MRVGARDCLGSSSLADHVYSLGNIVGILIKSPQEFIYTFTHRLYRLHIPVFLHIKLIQRNYVKSVQTIV